MAMVIESAKLTRAEKEMLGTLLANPDFVTAMEKIIVSQKLDGMERLRVMVATESGEVARARVLAGELKVWDGLLQSIKNEILK